MHEIQINKRYVYLVLIIIAILILRFFYATYLFNNKYKSDINEKTYTLMIVEQVDNKKEKITYIVKLNRDKFLLNIYKSNFEDNSIDISRYKNFLYLDILTVNAKISIPKYYMNKGEFNYKRYLNSKNIYGVINLYIDNESICNKVDIKKDTNCIEKLKTFTNNFKNSISNLIDKNIEENSQVVKSMIYGDNSNLEKETKEKFEKLGISHTLSVSGSNIATIVVVLKFFGIRFENLKKYNKLSGKYKSIQIKNIVSYIMINCILLMFLLISGNELSIIRATIMLELVMTAKIFNKDINKYLSLVIAYVVIFIFYPLCIFNMGCNLSFFATLGIIMFCDTIYKILNNMQKKIFIKFKKIWSDTYVLKFINKVINFAILSISLSVSVQALILPFEIENFHEISLNLFISNIIISLFDTPIRLIGVIACILSPIKVFSCFLFKCLNPIIYLMNLCINYLLSVNKTINIISLPMYIYFIYYLIIFYFKSMTIKTIKIKDLKKVKRQKIIMSVITLILVLLVINFYIYNIYYNDYVTFFNVGQGDMSYIKYKEKSILIDCGSKSNKLAYRIIDSYFKTQNISKIDFLFVSHFHNDHVNGILDLLDTIEVGTIICANQKHLDKKEEAYKNYINIKNKATNLNILFKYVNTNEKIKIEDINVKVLSPEIYDKFAKDKVNASSLVLNFNIKDKNYLYMGDATSYTEKQILKQFKGLKVFILKVSHHGSKSSSDPTFVLNIAPQISVISAEKRWYNHPSKKTIETLNNNKSLIYQTEILGQIIFKIK